LPGSRVSQPSEPQSQGVISTWTWRISPGAFQKLRDNPRLRGPRRKPTQFGNAHGGHAPLSTRTDSGWRPPGRRGGPARGTPGARGASLAAAVASSFQSGSNRGPGRGRWRCTPCTLAGRVANRPERLRRSGQPRLALPPPRLKTGAARAQIGRLAAHVELVAHRGSSRTRTRRPSGSTARIHCRPSGRTHGHPGGSLRSFRAPYVRWEGSQPATVRP